MRYNISIGEDVRLAKNERIKTKGKATRERHATMRPNVVSLKLSLGCLNNKEREKLLSYFIQCRWLCNYLLGLSNEEFSLFDTKERDITSLDKDGNKNGKYKNTVHIAGIKRPIRVFGMEQLPPSAEYTSAKLIKRPSGVYLALTCFVPNSSTPNSIENINASNAIGIDFGIKTTITTSSGEKFDISIRESERLIGLQRKLSRQKKGSKSYTEGI